MVETSERLITSVDRGREGERVYYYSIEWIRILRGIKEEFDNIGTKARGFISAPLLALPCLLSPPC